MVKPKYRTDLTAAQWQILEPMPRKRSRRGRPAKYHRRSVINAIFYMVLAGCQWRTLPSEFPPWEIVYQIFYRWRCWVQVVGDPYLAMRRLRTTTCPQPRVAFKSVLQQTVMFWTGLSILLVCRSIPT